MLKEMFKEHIHDFYGCCVDAPRIPIVLRKGCEIIGNSIDKKLSDAPSGQVICLSADCCVFETALSYVSIELGLKATPVRL